MLSAETEERVAYSIVRILWGISESMYLLWSGVAGWNIGVWFAHLFTP